MTALGIGAALVFFAWLAWLTRRVVRHDVSIGWLRHDANGLLTGHRKLLAALGKLKRRLGWRDDFDGTQVMGDPLAMTRRMDPDMLEQYRTSIAPERSGVEIIDRAEPPSLPDGGELAADDDAAT